MGKITCQKMLLKTILICYITSNVLCDGNFTNHTALRGQRDANIFLTNYNRVMRMLKFQISVARFYRETNMAGTNSSRILKRSLAAYSLALKRIHAQARLVDLGKVDKDTWRQLTLIRRASSSRQKSVVTKVRTLKMNMKKLFLRARVANDPGFVKSLEDSGGRSYLNLNDHLSEILSNSTDEKELRYVWEQWRKAVGPPLRSLYAQFVKLNNIGARENDFQDAGDYKRKIYEVDNLDVIAEKFWDQLKPFYEELHAYVRYRMTSLYPDIVKDGEPLLAHVMGNMWAQSWVNLYKHVKPYPDEPGRDVTNVLLEKKYNATLMFKKAEEFFQSIGWQALPGNFWKKSMIVRPEDPKREVVCHASAWDFAIRRGNGYDVRVKMCTKVNQEGFNTIHHELGHIYYYLMYWDQPSVYRTGANPGFHEAVGDTLVLSVQTPTHLKKIGLLDSVSNSTESDINFLLGVALEKIAFLPFAYLMDQWMWKVYSEKIKLQDYNKAWWEMKLEYQGIKPPSERGEEFFDPGAKYHIAADIPYIRYFFSGILQFLLHKHACAKAGWKGPLFKCSIYQSKEAGDALRKILELGKSKQWQEILEQETGSRHISTDPIKEYFSPLYTWLKNFRLERGYSLGWSQPLL